VTVLIPSLDLITCKHERPNTLVVIDSKWDTDIVLNMYQHD
jgi:hypothetical protein